MSGMTGRLIKNERATGSTATAAGIWSRQKMLLTFALAAFFVLSICGGVGAAVAEGGASAAPASPVASSPAPAPASGLAVEADGRIVSVEAGAERDASQAAGRRELPEFDQAAIVADQRERLEGIGREIGVRLHAAESDNFLLFSDLDSRVRDGILVWLEDFRVKVMRMLRVGERDRLWDGKCLVLVFSNQESLQRYGAAFDRHAVGKSRGYFALEARMSDGPRLVHIATYQDLEEGNRGLREVLVHEATHAVVELQGESGELPLWVHEGLAELLVVTVDPTQRALRQERAYNRASRAPYVSIEALLTKRFSPRDVEDYAVSFSLVEVLHRRSAAKLREFVDLLKGGSDPAAALDETYGLTFAELERLWRGHVLQYYRPSSPGAGRDE